MNQYTIFTRFKGFNDWHWLVLGASLGIAVWTGINIGYNELLPQRTIRAANKPKGTYEGVITNMAETVSHYHHELGFHLNLESRTSEGSTETLQQLKDDLVDIGIVQGDTDITRQSGGVVLALYDEVFLAFTHSTNTTLISVAKAAREQRRKVTISCLGKGSQSYLDVQEILKFYGVSETEFELIKADYPGAAAAVISNQVDVAFFITAIDSPLIKSLAREPGIRLLPLADYPAITNRFRGVSVFDLPCGALGAGFPAEPLHTLATPALLMAGNGVQKRVVSRLASTLNAHRWELEKRMPFLSIRPAGLEFESILHPGAAIAFGPPTEGVFKKYSEHIKLLLGAPATLVAVMTFVGLIRRDKENPSKTGTVEAGDRSEGAF